MIRFDLRTKIAGTICALVVAATLLIDLVFVVTLQRELIEERIQQGRSTLRLIGQRINLEHFSNQPFDADWFRKATKAEAIAYIVPGKPAMRSTAGTSLSASALERMAKEAGGRNRSLLEFSGQTWGVFWRQHRFAMVAVPVGSDGAGAAAAFSLDGVYQRLRNTQKVVFIYLLINAVVLTMVGVVRLSRMAVRPIDRLLKRAEDYQDDGSVLFLADRGDSEFSRLSRALNHMLQRISEDRETLRETVRSLERSNLDLKKAQSDIIQAEKLASVGRLSSGIAHEIGNPIGIVLGYLELLRQPEIGETERTEYIQRAQQEINRISTILRQLLDFSRPASDTMEQVSVHNVLHDMIELVKVQPLMAHVSVQLELEARLDRVEVDPNQLRQVFLNLVINAADAVSLLPEGEEGRLTIGSENPPPDPEAGDRSASMLKVQFADNGPGISKTDLGNVFDPFFTTKAPGKGTGLGLSVCFMIIEKMGGRIFAESGEHQGTVITLYLPLSSREET